MNEIATIDRNAVMETVMVKGDLSKLTPQERTKYYFATCESLGLNPMTRPFDYIVLNGKMQLYAKRDAADQLRKLNGVNVEILEKKIQDGMFLVTVRATDKSGRMDEDMGIVAMPNGAGEVKANAMLKAITKAKRRVTLSICGLGFLDETEAEDIPEAQSGRRHRPQVRTIQSEPAIQHDADGVVLDDVGEDIADPVIDNQKPVEPQSYADKPVQYVVASEAAFTLDSEALIALEERLTEAAKGGTDKLKDVWLSFSKEDRKDPRAIAVKEKLKAQLEGNEP